jgi:hypothetical protein
MISADDIQARLRQLPFVPFRIETSSGQAFDVSRPDLVQVGSRSLIIGLSNVDDPSQFQTASRVPVIHVIDLRDLPGSASSDENKPAS